MSSASDMIPGVSVVLCCHNSAARLPQTLRHLAVQQVPEGRAWEVIVVDNASTDATRAVAEEAAREFSVPFRVVAEPRPGLAFARIRGLAAAHHEVVSFVDDDNWVCDSWVAVLAEIFAAHPEVGACGGRVAPAFEAPPPAWFGAFQRSYAVGAQALEAGDITWQGGVLFGAGLAVRRTAWQALADASFHFQLVGRRGNKLLSGEDYELCQALRMAGWRLWYDPRLELEHFMPASRLDWDYLCQMMRRTGHTDVVLEIYFRAARGQPHPSWVAETLRAARRLGRCGIDALREGSWQREGDPARPNLERSLGRLMALLRLRDQHRALCGEIDGARWNRRGKR